VKFHRLIRAFIPLVAFLVLVVIAALIWHFYQKPLGPALNLSTRTPSAIASTATGAIMPAETLTPGPTSTATPQPLCGGPAVMTLLAIGSDARANSYLYGLADIIRLVRVDFVRPRVTILEVPRDLWVKIPDIADHYNLTEGKLNQSYLFGNPGMGYYDGPGEGPGLLARTLELNFGARPNHYIAVNMQTFVNLVDYLGGLDVYLPYDVDGRTPEYPDAFFVEAGQHHFDGYTALMTARIRQYSVFGRADNQNIILCALRKKLLSPKVVTYLPQITQDFLKYVQTDLSPEQISQLSCLANQVHGQDIIFVDFPTELFKVKKIFAPSLNANTHILDADFDVLRDYIARFEAGTWPDPAELNPTTPSPGDVDADFTCDD
jgi:LCP family protein required for cell wall assembly